MLIGLSRERFWIAANILGLALYLYFASKTWIEPELRGENVATGGVAMVWGLSALPILLVFFLADGIWFAMGLARGLKRGDWRTLPALVVVGLVWLGTVWFDFARH